MKVVLNKCCGSFGLSEDALKILELEDDWMFSMGNNRTDENLIKLIEDKGAEFVEDEFSKLVVKEIPNETTDFVITEENGYETMFFVVNGKIHRE